MFHVLMWLLFGVAAAFLAAAMGAYFKPNVDLSVLWAWYGRLPWMFFGLLGAATLFSFLTVWLATIQGKTSEQRSRWITVLSLSFLALTVLIVATTGAPYSVSFRDGIWKRSARFGGSAPIIADEAIDLMWLNVRFFCSLLAMVMVFAANCIYPLTRPPEVQKVS